MLANVNTIHTPETLDDATHLLMEADVRPLYGGVALHREAPLDVNAVVDLSLLGIDQHRAFDTGYAFGGMMTLQAILNACETMQARFPTAAFLVDIIKDEAPVNMRNTMTLGDLLIERRANSVLLTALVLFDAQVDANGWPRFIHDWVEAPDVEVRNALITEVALEQGHPNARTAYEKVSRTPKDAPIIGAMAYVQRDDAGQVIDARLAMCGVASQPIPLADVDEELIATNGDIDAALKKLDLSPPGDHWGSSDYRAEMARVLARRVLTQTLEQ
jgi:CO/xanthine dehydrogenase FAD-binding subunit